MSRQLRGGRLKTALITGITAQEGSYLAEFLLGKCHEVHRVIRRELMLNTGRIEHSFGDRHFSYPELRLPYGDLTDGSHNAELVKTIGPHEIHNLAAKLH